MQQRTYRIMELLGRGGYGSVYRAEKSGGEGFSTVVALKMLHPEFVGPGTPVHAADAARRLRDEARLLGLLRHRAIVQVYDLVVLEGNWTIVMEYVEGLDLGRLLEGGPVPERQALETMGEVAHALSYAWHLATTGGRELRLLHRDIKPSNVMVTADGGVKVLDFGIARAEFEQRESSTSATVLGTRAYMAPERIDIDGDGGAVGPEADIYSLGAVLFELLAGSPPPRAALDPDVHALRMRQGVAERLSGRIDPRVQQLVEQMTCFDPGSRPGAEEIRPLAEQIARDLPGDTSRTWAERTVPPAVEAHRRRLAQARDALVGSLLHEMTDIVAPPPPARPPPRPKAEPPRGITLAPNTPPPQGITLAPDTPGPPPGNAPPPWRGAATSVPREPIVVDEERIVPVGLAFDDDRTGPVSGVRLSLDSLDGDDRAPMGVRGPPLRPESSDRDPGPTSTPRGRAWILMTVGIVAVLAVAAVLVLPAGKPVEEVLPPVLDLPSPDDAGSPSAPAPVTPAEPPPKTVTEVEKEPETAPSKPSPRATAPEKAPQKVQPEARAATPPDADARVDHSEERRSAIDALRGAVAPEPGTVTVEGDAVLVQLASGGARFSPGDRLEPGRYEIWARFPNTETPTRAGVVDVPSGASVVVRCDAALGLCAPR